MIPPRVIAITIVSGLLLMAPLRCYSVDNSGLYASVPSERYVTGQFSASKQPGFVALDKSQTGIAGRHLFLRHEAGHALTQMIDAFRKQHPDIKIWVASAHRSFYRQRSIWEAKWTGRRKVEGQHLNKSLSDTTARAKKILEYSAMPGASRHHWGTEIDFNRLRNSYYESGSGLILYTWLQKNAATYGYCQPYTAGRAQGHHEEKWHWSYRPLAAIFQQQWETLFANNTEHFLKHASFAGNKAAAPLAPVYQRHINKACRKID